MKIEVKGHSGCRIDVVNDDSGIYVYKSTADPNYLKRLALQAKKQIAAAKEVYQHIRVPEIYDLQQNADTTIVKMQYVYSKNFIEFFEQAGFEQVDYFIGALKYFVDYEIAKCELRAISPSVFYNKFLELKSKCLNNPLYKNNQDILNILCRSEQTFRELGEMVIPVGTCHGDLTFSNILFNGNNYYLIDFLDSFIETPLQDIVKIRQDTQYQWSQLMYTKPFDATRLRIVCDKIDREIHRHFSAKYTWYAENYLVMQLMNILRILPYAREHNVISYLSVILNDILNKLSGSEENNNNSLSLPSRDIMQPSDVSLGKSRSLIMPIAVYKPEYQSHIPPVFLLADDGVMHCIHALKSLDVNAFDHIYITILRDLNKKYALAQQLQLQLCINNITNAEIVELEEPTHSQPETIYQTIRQKHINGAIVIKDADCSFIGEDTRGNAITIHPLEQLDWVNPKNKSYVSVDDMYYITNIIEKRIVSHYFTAGGYSFASALTFCQYYERFQHQPGLYLSHIIYAMLLEGHTFRPVLTTEYEDFESRF